MPSPPSTKKGWDNKLSRNDSMNIQKHLVFIFLVLATLFLGAQVVPPAKSGGSYQVTVIGDVHFDSLDFQTIDGAVKAIGVDPCSLCTYCWNGKE